MIMNRNKVNEGVGLGQGEPARRESGGEAREGNRNTCALAACLVYWH
jgi:hypothetical protein